LTILRVSWPGPDLGGKLQGLPWRYYPDIDPNSSDPPSNSPPKNTVFGDFRRLTVQGALRWDKTVLLVSYLVIFEVFLAWASTPTVSSEALLSKGPLLTRIALLTAGQKSPLPRTKKSQIWPIIDKN